jgi:hypothetical protein
MKRLALTVTLFVAVTMPAGPGALAVPKPTPIPVNWELEMRTQPLESIEVQLPGHPAPQLFWFFRYTVVNNTGQDVIFVPDFVLYTDTGQIIRAGQRVPTAVFRQIKQLYNEPLLKDMTAMTGKLLQGEDNAREGVAIWRDFDPKAGGIDIFIGGLSGESAEVQLPTTIEVVELDPEGNEVAVTKDTAILIKTMDMKYSVPGEAASRNRIKPKLLDTTWVMR